MPIMMWVMLPLYSFVTWLYFLQLVDISKKVYYTSALVTTTITPILPQFI